MTIVLVTGGTGSGLWGRMKQFPCMVLLGAIFCAAFFCMFASVGHSQERAPTVLAYVDFPPYEYQENGQPKGILVGIVRTVFQRAGLPLELVYYPFKRAQEETRVGSIDGLFNFYKIPERLTHFDYSEPLIINPLVLFVRRDSGLIFNGSLSELAGLNIGAMQGYTYGAEFDQSALFTIDRAGSHELNFQKLLLGRIDAYPCDKLVGQYVLRAEGLSSQITFLSEPVNVMQGHIGFAKGRHQDVLRKINPVIREMRKSGELDRIVSTQFPLLVDFHSGGESTPCQSAID